MARATTTGMFLMLALLCALDAQAGESAENMATHSSHTSALRVQSLVQVYGTSSANAKATSTTDTALASDPSPKPTKLKRSIR